jgi:hypothetical protein
MNTYFNNLKLSQKAKIVIESICIPNVMSESFIQSKCVNNIILKMKGINNTCIWDSSTKGKGSSIIFSSPILLNSQGYGTTYGTPEPDLTSLAQKPRLNSDNNGYLFINPSPNYLYNYPISDEFLRNGILEFELIFDVANCWKNVANQANQYTYVPQTLNITTDKNDLEAFMISMIVMDEEDEDTIYNDKSMLNKINKLLIDKYNK